MTGPAAFTRSRTRRLSQISQNIDRETSENVEKLKEKIKLLRRNQKELKESLDCCVKHLNKYHGKEKKLGGEQSSKEKTSKQIEEYTKEVNCLKNELEEAKVDRVQLQKYEELYKKSIIDKDIALTKASALEEICSSQADQIKSLHYELTIQNEQLKETELFTIKLSEDNQAKKKIVEDLHIRVNYLQGELVKGEKLRKKLHNTILELKGNIRVFCRVRPTLPTSGDDRIVVSYPMGVESLGREINLMHNAQNYSFTFDKVFSHNSSQEEVFNEISQLVQSALDGYKVCIFAYGPTGSGKTYTMMGRPEAQEKRGLIPRSMEKIFDTIQALTYHGWKHKVQASMLEIYNETIRDLLSSSRCNNIDTTCVDKQYKIKHDSVGNTFVSNLTVVDVCSINEVSFLLNQAVQSRSVGKTQMNEQSSRSHFVFTLRISGNNDSTEQQVQGVLNLIDLAGSERLTKSGATGDRLKETQAINKSLSSLSDVIFAIARKDDYVPYRNSKLTYLLQPCLGGDSKTLMFVNISPEASSADESICSLRFASRVNSCEIGVPRRYRQTRPLDIRTSHG